MNRHLYILGLLAVFLIACNGGQTKYYVQSVEIPSGFTHAEKVELSARVLPHPRQMKWFEDEFFGFIHYGLNTFTGKEWGTGFEDAAIFQPGGLDTDQWCRLMASAGIKRVVMVAKHHEGYCLWPTRYTEHSVVASPWMNGKGDVIKEVAESCEKYGLRLGIYLSPADLYQIESADGVYGNESDYTKRTIPRKVENRPFEDKRTFTYLVDDYNEYFLNQLFELLTEYGPIYELWFDGAHPKPGTGQTYNYDAWFDLIRNLAPDAVIFGKGPDARWCGNEGGATRAAEYNVLPLTQSPDSYDWPDKKGENIAGRDKIVEETRFFHYYPAEINTSIRHGWFWRNDDEQQVRNADDVFDMYERSVGGNSVLHLNIPPNKEGKFSNRDAEVLEEVGRRIRAVYGTDLLSGGTATSKKVLDNNPDTFWEAQEKNGSFEITLPQKSKVNRILLQEAIAHRGERVEEHYLEAFIDGEWIKVAEGKTIGYKRILRFPAVMTDRFRITITQSRLEPTLSKVSAHYYDEPPKPVIISSNENGQITLGVGTSFSWKDQGASDLSQSIYYTLDGSEPTSASLQYTEPLKLPLGGHLKARAMVDELQGAVSEWRVGILKKGWQAFDQNNNGKEAAKAVDDDLKSSWIAPQSDKPELTIDMQNKYSVSGFAYTPDSKGNFIESFNVEVSLDGKVWRKIHKGVFGNIRNDPSRRVVLFDKTHQAKYVKFTGLKAPGNMIKVGVAEIDILSE